MMEALARHGFSVEAFTGTALELGQDLDPDAWLASRGFSFEACGGEAWSCDIRGVKADEPTHYRLCVRNVPITVYRSATSRPHEPFESERDDFLKLYDRVLERFRPDVLVTFGADLLSQEVRVRARRAGASIVFALHNLNYLSSDPFTTADAIFVPSQFAARYYHKALGSECSVLPNMVDLERVRVHNRQPRYVTFVNPSIEKGVYAFVRIAAELGRLRPDIPILVVESRGTEATLVDCGIDLRDHGNVFLMTPTPDPRDFWRVTRVCLVPSLCQESQGLVAVEAMINGIPVIASDRGALPETLGRAGLVLPLPDRLTPSSRILPDPEEVAPWVEAIIHLWDDDESRAAQEQLAMAESSRWAPEELEPLYVRFFSRIQRSCPNC